MIVMDDREDADIIKAFSPFGIGIERARLEYADFCWQGNGPDGDVMVGMERKTISDLINSMRNRRLSGHQLQGLCDSYDYIYLMVEGLYRAGPNGVLECQRFGKWLPYGFDRRHPIMYREIDNYLSTLERMTPLVVRRSTDMNETAAQVVDLYKWWTEKQWADHHAHEVVYAPAWVAAQTHRASFVSPEELIRRKYGEATVLVLKWATQLPGIDRKAQDVAIHFRTPDAMMAAGPWEWMKIPGIGKILADRCWSLIHAKTS